MGDWREYKISDIADVIGGGTPKTSIEEYWNGDIPWLAPRDLTGYDKVYISHGDRFITKAGLKNSSTKLMPKGSVLLTSRAPIGYVAIAENEICTNQGFKSLVPKENKCNSEFLYYWIKNHVDYLQQLGTGTAFAEISGSVVKSIDILLPPLEEQKAIAEVLSSLDDKIDLLHRQNKTLEELAQTLFRQWFIEEAKDEWQEKQLQELLTIKRGGSPRPIQDFLSDSGYRWLKISDVTKVNSPYIFDIKEHIKEEGLKKTTLKKRGSLVLSNSATPAIPKILQVDSCIHDGWLHFPESSLSNEFLYLLFNQIRPELLMQGNGSIFTNLKTDILKEFTIKLPDNKTLESFQVKIDSIFNKLLANAQQIKTLENMRDTLLPKLMSGEVRING
jgi:type I restriction enzyme S subunit